MLLRRATRVDGCNVKFAAAQRASGLGGIIKELAQNGGTVKHAPRRNSEFLRCLGARIRRLWAIDPAIPSAAHGGAPPFHK